MVLEMKALDKVAYEKERQSIGLEMKALVPS